MHPAIRSLAAPAALYLLLAGSAHAFDVTVTSAATSSGGSWTGGIWTPTAPGSVISAAEVAAKLATGDVTINATGADPLTVRTGFAWSAHTLTLHTDGAIAIRAPLSGSGAAGLALEYGNGYAVNAPVTLAATGSYSTKQGASAAVAYTILTSLGAEGGTTGLQGMAGGLNGNYALGTDIDASATAAWNGNSGFMPVGNGTTAFTGRLDGLGHSIDRLTIDRGSSDQVGLFGVASAMSSISNLTLARVNIVGRLFVGALAGDGNGAISNCHVTGNVTGGRFVGGLVGQRNAGSNWVRDSHTDVAVAGTNLVGGLVGNLMYGNISGSYASGPVTGDKWVGGLLGEADAGSLIDSYASGAVSGNAYVGGLVGSLQGQAVARSFASGAVSGTGTSPSYVGGLIGQRLTGTVTDSYWNTDTSSRPASQGGTGVTTAQLAAGLPGGLNDGMWGNAGGKSFPYLLGNPAPVPLLADPAGPLYRIIVDAYQLQAMQDDLAGNYALGADIDASTTATWNGGAGFMPVGDDITPFTGRLDGLGRVISGLRIVRPGQDTVGLIGHARNATLANLGLEGGSVTGLGGVGALAGHLEADGGAARIANAYATTAVTSSGVGSLHVGGLVGLMSAAGGGTATISDAYASGAVAGDVFVGGLLGTGAGNSATIARAYATGAVAGSSGAGGLVGVLMGGASVANSLWDKQTTGQSASAGGAGRTTAEMRQLATFTSAGWSIDDTGGTATPWRIYNGFSYPLLRSLFTDPLTATAGSGAKPYDGTPDTALGVTYSPTAPDARLLGTATTVADGSAPGTHAVTVGGIYSTQRGYDIARINGTLTITPPDTSAVPLPGGGTAAVTVSDDQGGTCAFRIAQFTTNNVADPLPAGVTLAGPLFSFVLGDCAQNATATIRITYPSLPAGAQYWKHGPRSGKPTGWYQHPATVNGNTITFSITNGADGDDDMTANGEIVDAGAPALATAPGGAAAIPTLSPWGMLLLSALLGLARLRRRA